MSRIFCQEYYHAIGFKNDKDLPLNRIPIEVLEVCPVRHIQVVKVLRQVLLDVIPADPICITSDSTLLVPSEEPAPHHFLIKYVPLPTAGIFGIFPLTLALIGTRIGFGCGLFLDGLVPLFRL